MRSFRWCPFRLLFIVLLLLLLYYYYHSFTSKPPSRAPPRVRIMYIVRTISKYYSSRLVHLLDTWISLVSPHVYFVSDTPLPNTPSTHFVSTDSTCGTSSHSVRSLCCQTAHDYLLFRAHRSDYDWLCHFDDDQYVHVDNLEQYLASLDFTRAHYVGRHSWNSTFKRKQTSHPGHFWFATLGAGVCLSARAVDLLEPFTRTALQFADGCVKQWYPDDIYIGFLLSNRLNVSLTKNLRFHSHLERTLFADQQQLVETFDRQITFGFRLPKQLAQSLPELFPRSIDPLRMRTLHCLLYPHVEQCRKQLHKFLLGRT